MAFDAVMERFVKESPVSVMARLAMERALNAEWLDGLFEQHRERQYTRELLFSTVVELMSVVAMGLRPSLHAAAQATEVGVSVAALYEKVNRMELGVVRALVRGSAERLSPVVQPMKKEEKPWAKGYRVRVMDGNHLPASEKRLKPLRGFRGAALPGHALVVYAPEEGLVVDVVPCEDAHAQERTLVPAVLEHAQAGDLWLADRNFSTTGICFGLSDRQAAFVIREHGSSPNPAPLGKLKKVGRVETGVLFEQAVQVEDENGRLLTLRRIELHLDVPTEDGETLIRLLTNAPQKRLSAKAVARLYRKRWSIGASRQGRAIQSVKVRPRLTDSGLVAREAAWRESKTLKPSDNILGKEGAQLPRLQRAVNADVASKHVFRWPRRSIACEGSMGSRNESDAATHTGGVSAAAWREGLCGNWRGPRHPAKKPRRKGPTYNREWEVEGTGPGRRTGALYLRRRVTPLEGRAQTGRHSNCQGRQG